MRKGQTIIGLLLFMQISNVALLSAQEHNDIIKKVSTQGHTIYYQKLGDDKSNESSIVFYLTNRLLDKSDTICDLTDRGMKLQELDYMEETHLLIDSIRETVTQVVGNKTITSLRHHRVKIILFFDYEGRIFNVGINIPSSIYGKILGRRQIYTILHHIHSQYPLMAAYAKLNKLRYNGAEMYSFPLLLSYPEKQ